MKCQLFFLLSVTAFLVSAALENPALPVWNSMAEVPTGELNQPSASTNDQDTMDPGVAVEDFISTGRTGRRNAVADISDPCTGSVSAAGMDFSFDKLSVTDPKTRTTGGDQPEAPCPPENSPSSSSSSKS